MILSSYCQLFSHYNIMLLYPLKIPLFLKNHQKTSGRHGLVVEIPQIISDHFRSSGSRGAMQEEGHKEVLANGVCCKPGPIVAESWQLSAAECSWVQTDFLQASDSTVMPRWEAFAVWQLVQWFWVTQQWHTARACDTSDLFASNWKPALSTMANTRIHTHTKSLFQRQLDQRSFTDWSHSTRTQLAVVPCQGQLYSAQCGCLAATL